MNHLIRAAALAGYEELATAMGLDVSRQLRRVGLSLAALRDQDALIGYPAMMQLLEHSASDAMCPTFGLRLSQQQGIETLGPVAVAVEHAATIGEAIDLASRYIYVHSPALRLNVAPIPGNAQWIDLCLAIELPNNPVCVQAIDLAMGVMLRCVDLLSQSLIKPQSVFIPHPAQDAKAIYEAAFGAPCLFGQTGAAVRIRRADLAQPLPHSNAMVRQLAQSYIDTQFTGPQHAFSDRVRLLIRKLLGTGQATHDAIAQRLAVHPRTMQRRLSDEHMTFEKIKDEVRQAVFKQMIESGGPSDFASLADLLDYTEPSALSRSCRRWFGLTPTQMREQRLSLHS